MSRRVLSAALLALLALAAWWPAGPCAFVFDDVPLVVENAMIQRGDALAALTSHHQAMSNRPLTSCWLALQRGLLGPDADGFRLVNVAMHAINVLLLAAVLRRALARPAVGLPPARADRLAFAIAAVFAVHPLAADAVAYVAQQSMLLMAMWFLLALLALPRALAAHRAAGVAVVACIACGMASKEEFVAAPILLLLYARAFHAASWRELRVHWPLWSALAATWLVLLYCVDNGPPNLTAGWNVRPATSAGEWLMTQAAVVLQYARLAVLPVGQRTYYDWPIVRGLAAAILPGLAVAALLAATVAIWRRRPAVAWPWLAFFLLLAPTSTILPLPSEVVAERRAYLPMLAVVVPLALLVERRLAAMAPPRRGAIALLLALALPLLLGTAARLRLPAYADSLHFWAEADERGDADEHGYQRGLVLSNRAMVLREHGDLARSDALLAASVQCADATPLMRTFHALSLYDRGDLDGAEPIVRTAIADDDLQAYPHALLASILSRRHALDRQAGRADQHDPRLREAEQQARAAVNLNPRRGPFQGILAWVLDRQGRRQEAEPVYRSALALAPERFETWVSYCDMLLDLGRDSEVQNIWHSLLASRPRDVGLRVQLAAELRRRDNLRGAAELLRAAAQLAPDDAGVRAALQDVESRLPR